MREEDIVAAIEDDINEIIRDHPDVITCDEHTYRFTYGRHLNMDVLVKDDSLDIVSLKTRRINGIDKALSIEITRAVLNIAEQNGLDFSVNARNSSAVSALIESLPLIPKEPDSSILCCNTKH